MSTSARLRSLDVFRGLAVAGMIVVNNPGDDGAAYAALRHEVWSGWTLADTIFPAFLWIIGLSMTLSSAARLERGDNHRDLLLHAIRRSVLLVLIGLFIEAFPTVQLDGLQWTGVLQKIGICYLLAAVVYLYSNWYGRIITILVLNGLYLGAMLLVPMSECSGGPWSMQCNIARSVDAIVLGDHVWHTATGNDPDGLLSLITATSTMLLGVLVGDGLRQSATSASRVKFLTGFGLVLVLAGRALGHWVPINKTLWTNSYALLMAGLATLVFVALHWLVDVRMFGRWLRPFEILGTNALVAYVVSRLGSNLFKIHVLGIALYNDILTRLASQPVASLLYSLINLAAVYVLVHFMSKRGWFIRI